MTIIMNLFSRKKRTSKPMKPFSESRRALKENLKKDCGNSTKFMKLLRKILSTDYTEIYVGILTDSFLHFVVKFSD